MTRVQLTPVQASPQPFRQKVRRIARVSTMVAVGLCFKFGMSQRPLHHTPPSAPYRQLFPGLVAPPPTHFSGIWRFFAVLSPSPRKKSGRKGHTKTVHIPRCPAGPSATRRGRRRAASSGAPSGPGSCTSTSTTDGDGWSGPSPRGPGASQTGYGSDAHWTGWSGKTECNGARSCNCFAGS